jgi:transposase
MTDILRLPGWTTTSIDETDEGMTIHAVYTGKPDTCQVCGVVDAALYKHGQRETTFLDTPFGKPTRILAKVQRYRCRECGGLCGVGHASSRNGMQSQYSCFSLTRLYGLQGVE